MKIESLRLKNFRMFRDVIIDKLPNCCFFVGANGSGKSSLFDIFGFLRDALTYNVKQALAKRGGFSDVISRGTVGAIELELKFRDLESTSSLVTYCLIIEQVENQPIVKREILEYQSQGEKHLIDFSLGKGKIITFEKSQEQELSAPDILAIKGLGQFQQFEVISELCRFIENWHLSDFQITEARKINQANGYDENLSSNADNLALFTQFMYKNYPSKYAEILRKLARQVPSISSVEPVSSEDGRIFLKFRHSAFKEPFQSWQVSDGTINLFAYLLLLYDPKPHSLLCVEEPEHHLYPDLLRELAEEFSVYAGNGQVFVSTHSPDFLNGAELREIFWLTQQNGYTQIHTTAENQLLKRLVEVGDLPGALWKQGFFEGVHP
ncbi:AAA family ATPase [Candidatus Parabeggiatoa sp. HSG14]|uniref:AAA family ATPase n=1 Tax=Candidatus Parabeggiatoa sp. HSG14 TaxID=3055593 RepID=UPI0025A7B344|nr:AAA family ATPase [Thiotrichales bacterium HSG14]